MPAVASYAPRGQSRRRRVQHFRNDNWPPRPPAQNLPVPSFLGSPDSEMLRALPTPSFVTPVEQPQREPEPEPEPEPEVKAAPSVPTKAVIAASAVPLADWFADVVWALYLGPTQTGGGNSGLAGADKAPQPLAAFVHAVLSQTLASPQCAALGLYYLVRLPVRLGSASVRIAAPLWNVGVDAEGRTCYASVQDRERAARAAFVAELYGPGGEDVPYRLAALALMLGNKWLDDHTFTNKTWHEVTHLSLARLTALEQRALECFNYSLGVANPDWRAWLGVLKEGAVGASAAITTSAASILGASAASMGVTVESNATSLLAVEVMERLEKEHEVLTGGVGAGVVDVFAKGVIGDRRQAPPAQPPVAAPQPMGVPVPAPASASEMELDELEMEQVEIDIDLDDGGPVPDELRRPVKMRLGAKGVWGEDKWEVKQETKKQGEDDQRELKELKDQEKGQWEEDEWDDEWERAVRAAGGDRREDWLMGIVEDGEDRYAHDRLAREERDYWIRPNGWDRAVQRPSDKFPAKVPFPSKTMYPGDKAVQRPSGKKELFVDEPRVELYDARLRCDSRPYYPTKAYGYEMREFPSKPYPKGSYEYSKQGVYEYPQKGVYYPSYEPGCVYDLGPDATAGFDYGCPYSYVPRQVPPPTWSNSCVLS